MDKRDFLFRFVEPPARALLRLDEEAYYSTTDQLTANKIAKILARVASSHATITDATACIGGATLAFAQTFDRVHAIEIDRTRYEYLCHNMFILGLGGKVHCVHGDAIKVCAGLQQDIIFLDPPWGGPEYKSMDRVSLSLSGVSLSEVCRRLSSATRYIAIKVPTNFDEAAFRNEIADFARIIVRDTQLRKMNLLVLYMSSSSFS